MYGQSLNKKRNCFRTNCAMGNLEKQRIILIKFVIRVTKEQTLRSFMRPSNWTISSRRVSWSADIRISSSSLRCRRTRSSVNRLGSHPICCAFLMASSCSSFNLRISSKSDLYACWEKDKSQVRIILQNLLYLFFFYFYFDYPGWGQLSH